MYSIISALLTLSALLVYHGTQAVCKYNRTETILICTQKHDMAGAHGPGISAP